MSIIVRPAEFNDLDKILLLQSRNLPKALAKNIQIQEGFVSVEHNLELLSAMNEVRQHTVAFDKSELIGYALAMDKSFGQKIPMLVSMFDQIDRTLKQGLVIEKLNYIVMGQVCIDQSYRGKGIFKAMYSDLQSRFNNQFSSIITEVATRNKRSIKAHKKVGFESILIHESGGEEWDILQWNW